MLLHERALAIHVRVNVIRMSLRQFSLQFAVRVSGHGMRNHVVAERKMPVNVIGSDLERMHVVCPLPGRIVLAKVPPTRDAVFPLGPMPFGNSRSTSHTI